MSLSVVRSAEMPKRNIFSRDLKVPSESLSLTVFGRVFQVCGAEKQKARMASPYRQLCTRCRAQSVHTVTCCDGGGPSTLESNGSDF